MENIKQRYGKIKVNYIEDEDNIHCICDCGSKFILTSKQIQEEGRESCGCTIRQLLLAQVGKTDDDFKWVGDILAKEKTANDNSSIGISYSKEKKKWRARITFQKKEFNLGYFVDKEDAIAIRKEAEENEGNFLEWYEGKRKRK